MCLQHLFYLLYKVLYLPVCVDTDRAKIAGPFAWDMDLGRLFSRRIQNL